MAFVPQQTPDLPTYLRVVAIVAPTPINFAREQRQLLVEPESFGVFRRQGIPLRFQACHLLLEFVDLPSGTRLPTIKTARIQEEWPANLLMVFIDGGCRQ